MNCFSCFSSNEKKAAKKYGGLKPGSRQASNSSTEALPQPRAQPQPQTSSQQPRTQPQPQTSQPPANEAKTSDLPNDEQQGDKNIAAETFTFRELALATRNFRKEYLLGEGGFGRVYKGKLEKTNQTVAIKQLDRNGLQGNREFLVEVLMLSLLHHEHLVNLIGYCADGEQRLLVYEYMSSGCLEDHLLGILPGGSPLSWRMRMKIALHAAKGLEYLHDKANPPVIYRDLKSSNILLDDEYNAKLSDFGLAKLGPMGDKTHVTTRVMGTYGYCAPEYQKTGQLTMSSDVYSFGVVLLEIITGKRAIDARKRGEPVTLVSWAQPLLKDHSRFSELVDPHLRGDFPKKSLNQAVAVAAMCVNEDASSRPLISDVVTALSCLPEQDPGASFSGPLLSNRPNTMTKPQTHRSELITTKEREKAVAEAIAWGQRSRNNNRN